MLVPPPAIHTLVSLYILYVNTYMRASCGASVKTFKYLDARLSSFYTYIYVNKILGR